MASCLRNWYRVINRTIYAFSRRTFATSSHNKQQFKYIVYAGFTSVPLVAGYLHFQKESLISHVYAKTKEEKQNERREVMRMAREMRFLSFASVEYEGNVFMTPLDFLDSVTEDTPKSRKGRKHLTEVEVKKMLNKVPSKKTASPKFMRSLGNDGLISYTEYLFLLCVLTKPDSGFRIAFNMFDRDGNEQVDKKEFLVLEQVLLVGGISSGNRSSLLTEGLEESQADSSGPVQGAARKKLELSDTTLTVHLFGSKGRDTLNFEDFERFMKNLQVEVLDIEFNEFSRGGQLISENDFARILLRYTVLDEEEKSTFLERLERKNDANKGITFPAFKDFCEFLNNLDDFALAMKIYNVLGKPLDKQHFARMVTAVSGHSLDEDLVQVVFDLFDEDDDGTLSHQEFLSVMKDRLHRGFRSQPVATGRWDNYKTCIKQQMRSQ